MVATRREKKFEDEIYNYNAGLCYTNPRLLYFTLLVLTQ